MITAEQIAKRLNKPKKLPSGSWQACCPAHDDKNPSLSITDRNDRPPLLHCWAGCEFKFIAAILKSEHGISLNNVDSGVGYATRTMAIADWPQTYRYQDENGVEQYVVLRHYDEDGKKIFSQFRPDGRGGLVSGIKGIERLPYRLPDWKDRENVIIVEGEQDVDALFKYGILATCNSSGANNWKPELNKWFRGKSVHIIPDNDEPGRKHARQVAKNLKGIAKEVFVSDICRAMKPKSDVMDYIVEQKGPSPSKLWETITGSAVPAEEAFREAPTAPKNLCLTVGDWLIRDISQPDFLLGELFSTTSRALLVGPTGAGKTNFGLALAGHMAAGKKFLHLDVPRPSIILYIDGELSRRWMKRLLTDLNRRMPEHTDLLQRNLHVLSLEDVDAMPPLNTPEGQSHIDELIVQTGAEFIIFDNIQALTLGDMKDEASWSETLPWVRKITGSNVGQLWLHHTGHEETRSYGTKTREWQMDTVMLMKMNSDDQIDFTLEFPKARTRTPDNRRYFEKVTISLQNDLWKCSAVAIGTGKKASPMAHKYFEALLNALIDHGTPMHGLVGKPNTVTVQQWKHQLEFQGMLDPVVDKMSGNRYRASFSKYRKELIGANMIAMLGDRVWAVRQAVAEG